MPYIDLKKAIDRLNASPAFPNMGTDGYFLLGVVEDLLKKIPSIEIVRCKDCREWQRNVGFVDSPNGHCFCHDIDTNGHDFCSYGEMKGGAE